MSETRTSHIIHRKKESTVFPADFFCETRISDPSQKYSGPKMNPHNVAVPHWGGYERSPRKVNTLSDSTSAFSKENEIEDIKFPEISKANIEEVVNNFVNPVRPKVSARHKHNRNDKTKIGVILTEKQTNYDVNTQGSPIRNLTNSDKTNISLLLLNHKLNGGNDKRININKSHVHLQDKFNSPSSNSKNSSEKDTTLNKSNSIAKYKPVRWVVSREGYESECKSNPKRIYSSSYKNYELNSRRIINPEEIKDFNILTVFDLDSDDNYTKFDPISDDTFEELWRLADEPSTLPDIFETKKCSLEATFQFCQEDYNDLNKENEGYISFEKILKCDNSHQHSTKTEKHYSSKAKDLNSTPFVVNKYLTPEYYQKTAYFGNDEE